MLRVNSIKYSQGGVQFSLFILRVGTGLLMLTHGWSKLTNFSEMAPHFFAPFHVSGYVSLGAVVFSEVVCAFLVTIGLLTRVALIPLLIQMLVVVLVVHQGDFSHQELGLHFLLAFIVLLVLGPGRFSVDRLFSR
jgi:putative oxidoreductase